MASLFQILLQSVDFVVVSLAGFLNFGIFGTYLFQDQTLYQLESCIVEISKIDINFYWTQRNWSVSRDIKSDKIWSHSLLGQRKEKKHYASNVISFN